MADVPPARDMELKPQSLVIRLNEPAPPKPGPSRSEKFFEWSKVLATPLATFIVTGLIGSYVSTYLKDREARETNERLYAQLLTQREQSDTLIRKDMFGVVIKQFLLESNKQDWGDKVLQLELLANNFSQSLDLAPLFKDVSRKLPSAEGLSDAERFALQLRIDQTASNLNLKQINSLARRGLVREKKLKPGSVDAMVPPYVIELDAPFAQLVPHSTDLGTKADDRVNFSVEIIGAELERKELEVRFVMKRYQDPKAASADRKTAAPGDPGEPLPAVIDVDHHFWVGRYDFPMLSNIQLPFGLRAALALTAFDVPKSREERATDSFAQAYLVIFPSSSASFKERQDYDDILLDMVRQRHPPTSFNAAPK